MVERFFQDISENRIRRDSFTSVAELELAIDLYVADHNAYHEPFIWTASASDILAKSRAQGLPFPRSQTLVARDVPNCAQCQAVYGTPFQ